MMNDFDEFDYAGKRVARFNLGTGCEGPVRVILEAEEDVQELESRLSEAVRRAILTVAPGRVNFADHFEKGLAQLCGEPHVIESREEMAERHAAEEAQREAEAPARALAAQQAAQEVADARAANPHNGMLGWWRVEDWYGYEVAVRADSEAEAVRLALESGPVCSGDTTRAEWIGEELPMVVVAL